MMKEFKIYKHPTLGVEVVKVGFSWPALFITFFWTLYHKLWAIAGIWFGCVLVLGLINAVAKDAANHGNNSGGLDFLLLLGYLAASLIPAFNGNQWREKNLVKRAFAHISTVQAATLDAVSAQLAKVAVSAPTSSTDTVKPNSPSAQHYSAVTTQAPAKTVGPVTAESLTAHDSTEVSLTERFGEVQLAACAAFDETAAYLQIANELETKTVDKGLWLKAMVQSGGTDEKQQTIAFTRLRLQQLQDLFNAERTRVLATQAARAQALAAQAELAEPRGRCPNARCGAVIPLASEKCPMCGSLFFADTQWCPRILPNQQRGTDTPRSPSDGQQMKTYGIAFDGERFTYGEYKYDKLSDAVNYAKTQRREP